MILSTQRVLIPMVLACVSVLAASQDPRSETVRREPLSPGLSAAVRTAADVLFDQLLLGPRTSGGIDLVTGSNTPGVDPLRTAKAAGELRAALEARGVRMGAARSRGSRPLAVSVVQGVKGKVDAPCELHVRDAHDLQDAVNVCVPFVEKPWMEELSPSSNRYQVLLRVQGHGSHSLASARSDALEQLIEHLRIATGLDDRLPEEHVRRSARRYEIDRFETRHLLPSHEGAHVSHVLYGLTDRHVRDLHEAARHMREREVTTWIVRLALLFVTFALCTLGYLHLDFKTRGYLSFPLKVVFFAVFVLVACAGFRLG